MKDIFKNPFPKTIKEIAFLSHCQVEAQRSVADFSYEFPVIKGYSANS